jgi:hypothetical protein
MLVANRAIAVSYLMNKIHWECDSISKSPRGSWTLSNLFKIRSYIEIQKAANIISGTNKNDLNFRRQTLSLGFKLKQEKTG